MVLTSLCSDTYFHDHLDATWLALDHVWSHQLRFLFWMYAALAAEIAFVDLLTYFFGTLSSYSIYRLTFGKLFLRQASHWQVLLTGFAFPRNAQPDVLVDVMTTDDHLYAGTVGDFFLNSDGELSGLLLKNFKRFKRAEFKADRDARRDVDARDYWKEIPGANFYLPSDKIANLNIRYETPKREIIQDVEKLLKTMAMGKSVTISLEKADSPHLGAAKEQAEGGKSPDN
jgi:hypothetical protein